MCRKHKSFCEYPEIPEGYNPATRRIETVRTDCLSIHHSNLLFKDEEPVSNVIGEVDGFKIIAHYQDDEPLHISREPDEKVVMPDYTGKSVLFIVESCTSLMFREKIKM